MEFMEISAKTVDEAITKACITLETSSDNLEIQVITEGSSGFLGFGSKPAVIKARRKTPEASFESIMNEDKPAPKKEERRLERAEKAERPEKYKKTERVEKPEAASHVDKTGEPEGPDKDGREERPERRPEASVRAARGSRKDSFKEKRERRGEYREKAFEKPAAAPRPERKAVIRSEEEIEKLQQEAKAFLEGVFKAMELTVAIEMKYDRENDNLDIDFSGDDMGVLIGKRGQTLDSLQYLTSLVVNKDESNYVRVKLDTENYRSRRKDTLENLAKNIAFKVRKTRKSVSLEPMNPYERRIIHSALQGNKYVETYSEGSEPYRHVVVALKK